MNRYQFTISRCDRSSNRDAATTSDTFTGTTQEVLNMMAAEGKRLNYAGGTGFEKRWVFECPTWGQFNSVTFGWQPESPIVESPDKADIQTTMATISEWERRNNEACAQWKATFTEIARDYSARKRALASKPLKDRISKQGYEDAARIEADNKAALDAATLAYYAAISEPAKEEFASVVIPPDAFGALTEDRPRDWSHSDIAAWAAEYERNNPAQQHAPSFGWANPEGN